MRTNGFDNLYNKIFLDEQLNDNYVAMYGLLDKKRKKLWVDKRYISTAKNFGMYKLLLPKANKSGKFGESFSDLIISSPFEGHTQSFISMGAFLTINEVLNLKKYIMTKFCRCMLSILRVTADITPFKWQYVPLQDFSENSDINWTKTISNIDLQLYKKYGLSHDEIDFIEKMFSQWSSLQSHSSCL